LILSHQKNSIQNQFLNFLLIKKQFIMKKLIQLLMYVSGFIEGNFVQAIKTVFNLESLKHLKVDKDGNRTLELDKLLRSLTRNFNTKLAQLYMFMSFVQVIINNELREFFKSGFQGEMLGTGYGNLNIIIDLIEKLTNSRFRYNDKKYRDALDVFYTVLTNLGKQQKLVEVKCKYCNNGIVYGDVKCNVCNGTGKVKQWVEDVHEIDDDVIDKMYNDLKESAAIVAEILDAYLQYYASITMYEEAFPIDKYRTGNTTFDYNCDVFHTPIYCNAKGVGKFPNKNIKMSYTYGGIDFMLPALVMNPELIESNESRFKSTVPVDDQKSTSETEIDTEMDSVIVENKKTSFDDGDTVNTSEEDKYTYIKKNGEYVVGYGLPKWKKYYVGDYDAKDLHIFFSYEDYTRDEVRQAFASIAGVPKSKISVRTVSE